MNSGHLGEQSELIVRWAWHLEGSATGGLCTTGGLPLSEDSRLWEDFTPWEDFTSRCLFFLPNGERNSRTR